MIAIDSSALFAIVAAEPEAAEFAGILRNAATVVSAATLLETSIALETRKGADAVEDLKRLLRALGTRIADVDHDMAWRAHAAWRTYGKGRHPAGLNYGDCFSYALAMSLRAPLLFKGDDFARTEVTPAR